MGELSMKKGLAILLALSLCVMLSGCSQEERAQRSYEILVKLGDRQPTPEPVSYTHLSGAGRKLVCE